MRWTWDPEKAKKNLRKHNVSFELAERALGDPDCLAVPDPHEGEERWRTLGSPSADGVVVLYVVHTLPNDEEGVGRIISARKATARERLAYEEG
ncbi:MAG TPA: BrnT family toxin [Terracidiphilus sp.]|nr:BrnT family toxin [Terracidiphilus sp.]